jgi:hypothetical protein
LGDKIAQEEWDMVAQLACQILSKQQEDAADQIMTALLDRKSAKGSKHADVNLRFAATSLQYIIPSTRVRRLLTEAAPRPYLRAVIRNWKNHSFGGSSELRDTMPGLKAVAALLEADQENQDTIWLALQEKLLRSSTTPLGIAIAIEVLSVLPFLNFDSSTFKEKYNRSLPMISTIAKYREKLFYESAREFFPIASIGLSEGLITVPELVEWHGLDSITLEYEHRACPGVHPSSLLEVLYHGLTEPHWYDAEFRPKILNIAKDLGRMLESIDPPWLQDMPMGPHFFHDRDERSQESGAPLPREFLFSAFAVVAIYTESLGRREKEPLQRLLASEIVFSNLRNTFAARVGDKNALKLAEAEISKSGLSPKQQAIALQWAHGNVSFISRTGIRERRHRIGPASA